MPLSETDPSQDDPNFDVGQSNNDEYLIESELTLRIRREDF